MGTETGPGAGGVTGGAVGAAGGLTVGAATGAGGFRDGRRPAEIPELALDFLAVLFPASDLGLDGDVPGIIAEVRHRELVRYDPAAAPFQHLLVADLELVGEAIAGARDRDMDDVARPCAALGEVEAGCAYAAVALSKKLTVVITTTALPREIPRPSVAVPRLQTSQGVPSLSSETAG